MQNKTTQHKHKTLYAINRGNKAVKNKEKIKDYIITMIKANCDYVLSVPNIHSVWS